MDKYNERGLCQTCNVPETMQHILFNCKANQSKIIWNVAKEISLCKNIPCPTHPNITTVMALPLLKVCSMDGHNRSGATSQLLIIMSQYAFLICKLRSKR